MKLLARFRKAAALPFVLLLVALNVIVVVALMVYATTELQASRNSGQAEVARAIAQSGIDIAAGLIAANSTNNGFVSYQRVTNVGGDWRLETKIANVVATNSTNPWQKAATNPSVLHSGFAAGTDGVDLNFPVGGNTTAGFIAPRINSVRWTHLSTNMFRMNWIYVYKGSTNDSKNLIGRVAYWVDDESSKLSLNYSGNADAYKVSTGFSDQWENFSIRRTNAYLRNFDSANWPTFIDLGGVAGISPAEAISILQFRGDPLAGAIQTTNFPSVLAVRIATNTAVASLPQQSELGFTATVYSVEDERSYATGKKRYDLLNILPDAPEGSTISNIKDAITNNYPKFAEKYDLDGYVSAVYSSVQYPGYFSETNSNYQPSRRFGTNKMYTRGLPLANEVSIKATIQNTNGTNNIDVEYAIELILLSQSSAPANTNDYANNLKYNLANSIIYPGKFAVHITVPSGTSFGSPVPGVVTLTGPTNAPNSDRSISNWFGGAPVAEGPTNADFTSALTTLKTNIPFTNVAAPNWAFPSTNIVVSVDFNNVNYQSFSFVPAFAPPTTNFAPGGNQTVVVYHLVAQPQGSGGYRGDPRFSVFTNTVFPNPWNSTNAQNNPQYSLGHLNTNSADAGTNWQIEKYTNAANEPDLVPPDLFFNRSDRGIPQWANNKMWGFGPSLSGVGWLGEVPVTTQTGDILAWSTPRFWGRGRPVINGTNYPPAGFSWIASTWLLSTCNMHHQVAQTWFLSRMENLTSTRPSLFFNKRTPTRINQRQSWILFHAFQRLRIFDQCLIMGFMATTGQFGFLSRLIKDHSSSTRLLK